MPEENKHVQRPGKDAGIIGENGLLRTMELPQFEGIRYVSHKTAGLQSASDMWIDRDRMYEGLHVKEPLSELVRKTKILK
jgi:hypothetical protein